MAFLVRPLALVQESRHVLCNMHALYRKIDRTVIIDFFFHKKVVSNINSTLKLITILGNIIFGVKH